MEKRKQQLEELGWDEGDTKGSDNKKLNFDKMTKSKKK